MDTTREERRGWRNNIWCHGGPDGTLRESFRSVGGEDLERLLNDAEYAQTIHDALVAAEQLSEQERTVVDLTLMLASAAADCAESYRVVAALEAENQRLKQQLYRMEMEVKEGRSS